MTAIKAFVTTAVIEALKAVQTLSGRSWEDLSPKAKIIGALEGFDSLTGIEATVLIEQKLAEQLGRTGLSLGRDSVFVSEDGRNALDLDEVASKICSLLEVSQ